MAALAFGDGSCAHAHCAVVCAHFGTCLSLFCTPLPPNNVSCLRGELSSHPLLASSTAASSPTSRCAIRKFQLHSLGTTAALARTCLWPRSHVHCKCSHMCAAIQRFPATPISFLAGKRTRCVALAVYSSATLTQRLWSTSALHATALCGVRHCHRFQLAATAHAFHSFPLHVRSCSLFYGVRDGRLRMPRPKALWAMRLRGSFVTRQVLYATLL